MPDFDDIKYVGRGGLNYDDNLQVFPAEDYRYALNCIQDEGGEYGVITNSKGNFLVNVTFSYKGINTVIGSCEDKELRALIWFVHNNRNHHSIIRYKIELNLVEFILHDEPILNFDLGHRINNAGIIGSGYRKMLFWTDNLNPPRKLNIAMAKGYTVCSSTSTTSTYTTTTETTSTTSTSTSSTSTTSSSSTSTSSTYSTSTSSTTTTSPPLPMFFSVSDYDGNAYTTVVIGNLEWMAENLKVTHYSDGTAIPNITDGDDFIADTDGAYCWYDNDISNKNTYGALYNWYAATNARNIAASLGVGWRIPAVEDWDNLIAHIGGIANGSDLKEAGVVHWTAPNAGATDDYGFAAIAAGNRFIDMPAPPGFDSMGEFGDFLSSGENGLYAASYYLTHDAFDLDIANNFLKSCGYSIRCVRNYEYRV